MKNKILAASVAGGLLVAAGLVTTVVSSPSVAVAEEGDDDAGETGIIPRTISFLSEVLSDLVGEGTITQAQADAVVTAAEDKAAALKSEFEERARLIRSLLEDGVITSDEKDQLPDDSPLLGDSYDEAWADGQLTLDEIRAHRFGFPHRPGFGLGLLRGWQLGALLDDGGIDQQEYDRLIESLPDDSPLAGADVSGYLADGLITPDELRELFSDFWGTFRDRISPRPLHPAQSEISPSAT